MAAHEPAEEPVLRPQSVSGRPERERKTSPRRLGHLRSGDIQLYQFCDDVTGLLVYSMIVFGPWAFGTTQRWSTWVMNVSGYVLGLLLAGKLAVRSKGYRPSRWDELSSRPDGDPGARWFSFSGITATLAGLTIAILLYCLVSAINARSTYHAADLSFIYHDCIRWLPHSLDSTRTWLAFWDYLGLACAFWAVRDWLLGKSDAEVRIVRQKPGTGASDTALFFPARLRRLLWVLAVSGGLLGMEGIIQRMAKSESLLFLVRPRDSWNSWIPWDAQFASYAYRANAAQYFNLLWPVILGFWWTLHLSRGFKRRSHHWLLVGGVIMAACPIISTSRGGALISAGLVVMAAFFLLLSHFLLVAHRQEKSGARRLTMAVILVFSLTALGVGYWLGWKALEPRMAQFDEGLAYRGQMYAAARPIAADYPVYGTGPGTFENVFQFYRITTATYWPAQLHNDWLETRITFGWIGSGLIALAFALVLGRWFVRGGIHGGRRFVLLTWLALAGVLAHGRFDFPLQIYSILHLFLVLCAVLFTLSRRP